jgi:hypothetical protein
MIKYYRGKWKYQLAEGCEFPTELVIGEPVSIESFIVLEADGKLKISSGYAWDGPSGPTWDSRNSMQASLVHDALYQLMRANKLDREKWREQADKELYNLCVKDGMWPFRARIWYNAVRKMAFPAADPKSKKEVQTAP